MARQQIFVDVETTGLDPRKHFAVEVAWWNLTTEEKGVFVPPHKPRKVLRTAEPEALEVNRYLDRIMRRPQDEASHDAWRLYYQFTGGPDGRGDTLVGCNVMAFDAPFLAGMFRKVLPRNDLIRGTTPWHYRPVELGSFAMPILKLADPPSLNEICELLELADDDGLAIRPNHGAERDVLAGVMAYRELQRRAGPPIPSQFSEVDAAMEE